MKAREHVILAHHQLAATMWGRGGRDYDEVSFAISDALAHAAQRLSAHAGERILDVATGTGWFRSTLFQSTSSLESSKLQAGIIIHRLLPCTFREPARSGDISL